MPGKWMCPKGHEGPWRYVEAIEIYRDVAAAGADFLEVNEIWETDEGYNEGVPGSAYLECLGSDGGSRCLERVPVPDETQIEWL